MKKISSGFTLIELLVVIAIIGILAGITISSLMQAKQKSRDTGRIRTLQETRTALELFYSDNGYYPYISATPVLISDLSPVLSNGSKVYVASISINDTLTSRYIGLGCTPAISPTRCSWSGRTLYFII